MSNTEPAAGYRRPAGSPEHPVRSVRVPDDVWQRAKARALADGTNINRVLGTLIRDYADGDIEVWEVTLTRSRRRVPAPNDSEPTLASS